jgi:hypothetical protein
MNNSIATQSSEIKPHRHSSCLNSEGQNIMFPTSLTNRRKRELDELLNSLPMYRRSYPFCGRRWQDWGENTRVTADAPTKTGARYKAIYVVLVLSLAIGLGNIFQTSRVQHPLPSALSFATLADPVSRTAPPDYARYQWVGYHRLSPQNRGG